jgi:hypothetical protein
LRASYVKSVSQAGRRLTIEEHLSYISDSSVREVCQKVLDWLQELDEDQIESKGLKSRISVKYKGNNFANIYTRRTYFLVSWLPDWKDHQVDSWDEFDGEMAQTLRKSFLQMGGLPQQNNQSDEEEE